MHKQISIIIFLLLIAQISFSQIYTGNEITGKWYLLTGGSYNSPTTLNGNYMQPDTGTFYDVYIGYEKGINPFGTPTCWFSYNYTANISSPFTYKLTRWVMTDTDIAAIPAAIKADVSSLDGYLRMISLRNTQVFKFSYIFDTDLNKNGTYNRFSELCGDSDYMVTWYGGPSDAEHFAPEMSTTSWLDRYWDVVNNYKSFMTTSSKGKIYDCFNYSASKFTYEAILNIGSSGYVIRNVTTDVIDLRVTCDTTVIDIPLYNQLLNKYVPKQYRNASGIEVSSYQLMLKSVPKDVNDARNAENDWFSKLYTLAVNFIKNYQNWLDESIPEPIKRTIFAIQDFFNLVILFIAFFIIYYTTKFFLSFRKSLKSSLTKAIIVAMQMFVFLLLLSIYFWGISHTWSYCAIKGAAVLTTLHIMGIDFQEPQSITDVAAVGWDIALIGAVGTMSSDCTSFYKTYSGEDVLTYGKTSSDFMNLSCNSEVDKDCAPIIIRGTVVLILFYIILMVLAVLWEMFRYIFGKVKSLETDIRKESEYDDEVEELE